MTQQFKPHSGRMVGDVVITGDAVQFDVTHRDGSVIVEFKAPVMWMGLSPTLARELARVLNQHADEIVKEGN